MDPIDRPDYNPNKPRPANPATMQTLRMLTDTWRGLDADTAAAHAALCEAVKAAKDAGHTYQQLVTATDTSVATIQRWIEKAEKA